MQLVLKVLRKEYHAAQVRGVGRAYDADTVTADTSRVIIKDQWRC